MATEPKPYRAVRKTTQPDGAERETKIGWYRTQADLKAMIDLYRGDDS